MANINEAIITYFGQKARVGCDRNCNKAWGINSRPKKQVSDDPDDYCFLADDVLGDAPHDPGTYEGGQAKPLTADEFPNKWCIRECERCSISEPGKWNMPLELKSFKNKIYNQPFQRTSRLT